MSPTIVQEVPSPQCLPVATADTLEDASRVPLKRGLPEESADDSDAANRKHHKSLSDGPPPPAPSVPSGRRARDLYEEIVHAQYPRYEPKSDFELLALGGGDYSYVEDGELEARLAQEWSAFVADFGGNPETVKNEVRRYLDELAEVTGNKPLTGDANVTIIPIPGSPYSLRMWPGSLSYREFCLDYVQADDTNVPVNRPPRYNLTIHVPTGPTPWLGIGGQPLNSLEASFGVRDEDILPGEEKFVVRDGMICVLEYPEQDPGCPVCFEVPIRADK